MSLICKEVGLIPESPSLEIPLYHDTSRDDRLSVRYRSNLQTDIKISYCSSYKNHYGIMDGTEDSVHPSIAA